MGDATVIRWISRRSRNVRSPSQPPFDVADFTPRLRTRLLILQPTPFCNINCDYCYLPHRNSSDRMDMDTVRASAERLLGDNLVSDALTVVWHAGEPLVMPIAFYEEAFSLIQTILGHRCAVSHSIQTNATLIDDAWCALFKRHSVRVGISVDGPEWLHDAHRRTRRGLGTHHRVLAGMAALCRHGIPYHAIAVVTAATLDHADAFCDFFLEHGVHEVGCNFDEAEGTHSTSSLTNKETSHQAFVARLLERSIASAGKIRFRELDMALKLIAEPLPTYRFGEGQWPDNGQVLPFALVTVAHNGDFGTFSPELLGQSAPELGDFILGNVHRTGFLESAHSALFAKLWATVERGIHYCDSHCAHFGFCGGGAPANKFYENGDIGSGETLYCRTMLKHPFDAVLTRLEQGDSLN